MALTATLQNHLRLDRQTFDLLQQVSRFAKDLYNAALYIQRQQFFKHGSVLSRNQLFHQIKSRSEYQRLSSDLGQQILILVNQNLASFFQLLKQKKAGTYMQPVRLPYYLDRDDHYLLTFISRAIKLCDNTLRLSLGHRGKAATGTRFVYLDLPPLAISPKQIRIVPRYKGMYFEIDYIYDIDPIPKQSKAIADRYLSLDLGLDNFATCATTNETAFIIEGSGIKSFNRWWNKRKARYQSTINKQGITAMTSRMAAMQRYRRNVINNYLNHVVRYIIDYCLDHQIGTIVVGDWGDMKRGLKMRKKVSHLFQTLPYGWLKTKLRFKAAVHQLELIFVDESYTSQDCFNCGLRRKENRVHRGLYRCIRCGMELNADINGALNIMKRVVDDQIINDLQVDSGEITSPSRIRLVEFV